MAGDDGGRLALEDYRPRQQLRVPATDVPRPRFPAIDAHNHLGSAFGGDWATRPSSDLAAVMDDAGVEAIVDLDGGWGDGAAGRDRTLAGGAARAGRGVRRARLRALGGRRGVRRDRGARACATAWRRARAGLKVWKLLGLRARDPARAAGRGRRSAPRPAVGGGRRARRAGHDPRRGPDRVLRARSTSATSAGRSSGTTPTGTSGRPGRAATPDADGLPAVRRADRRARGGRRPPPGDHVHRRARRLRRRRTSRACRRSSSAARTSTSTSPRGSPSSAASRTRHARSSCAGRTACCSGPTWRPTRAGGPSTTASSRSADESFAYDADPDGIPDQGRWRIHGLHLPDDVLRRVYRENALRLIRF